MLLPIHQSSIHPFQFPVSLPTMFLCCGVLFYGYMNSNFLPERIMILNPDSTTRCKALYQPVIFLVQQKIVLNSCRSWPVSSSVVLPLFRVNDAAFIQRLLGSVYLRCWCIKRTAICASSEGGLAFRIVSVPHPAHIYYHAVRHCVWWTDMQQPVIIIQTRITNIIALSINGRFLPCRSPVVVLLCCFQYD